MKKILLVAAALALLGACNREGPAEKAGRKVDQAADKAGRAIEKAGDNIRDTANGKR
jgi:hypothetical protein